MGKRKIGRMGFESSGNLKILDQFVIRKIKIKIKEYSIKYCSCSSPKHKH